MSLVDTIHPNQAGSLPGLMAERIRRSADTVAYRYFDNAERQWRELTWNQVGEAIERWRRAFAAEGLEPGQRVGVMMRNSPFWVFFEQAALSLGLVVVPLYTNDRGDNVIYIAGDADLHLLMIEGGEQWAELQPVADQLPAHCRLLSLQPVAGLTTAEDWLAGAQSQAEPTPLELDPGQLATIVYTSGTTGRPKGVMLSHDNLLWNAYSGLGGCEVRTSDVFLSFLPLSHTLERTVGHNIPIMAGAQVAYARSIPELPEDLRIIRPTVLVAVPRIFDRVYRRIQAQLEEKPPMARRLFKLAVEVGWERFQFQQGRGTWTPRQTLFPLLDRLVARTVRERLGGRLRIAISGGAPLALEVARVFLGLGVPVLQGYGLTESSPVIAVNPLDDNVPHSIGVALPHVEVALADNGELLTRSRSVMLGYWNLPEASREVIDEEGWLHTGDLARIEGRHVFITGRLKEIIVLANGEKVPPADMEMAITLDPLFEQAVVLGEGRPYLTALLVLESDQWRRFAAELGGDPDDPQVLRQRQVTKAVLERVGHALSHFPGYAQIRAVTLTLEPWSVENGLLTAALKMQRRKILSRFEEEIEGMYRGH